MVVGASCAQSSPNAGDFSGSDDGSDGGTSAASGSSMGTGSGGSSGTGPGSGATSVASDDSGGGGSDASTGDPANDSGSDSAGRDGGGSDGDSGPGVERDSGTSTEHDSGTGSDSGGGTGHDAGSGSSHDAGGGGADAGGGGTSSTCTQHDAVCSADNSGCNVGSYYLYDNQWNCGAGSGNDCGPESAYGCTDGNGAVGWVTTSNQPKGNTAVLSYPAMQDNFGSSPSLSSFTTISSTFTETSPHVGDYEVAWDCWFNDYANEFMVWVDTYNQVPAGPKVAANVSLGGRTYDIYWAPGGGGGGTVSFYATANFTSGTVKLLQLFDYGVSNGWLPSTSTVNQISFGTEVCSTNGESATWTVSDYSVTAH
jgi:Glycosyl hydrolase family 12